MARPRKPTATKALSNTLRPDRTNPKEPRVLLTDTPVPPRHLSAKEKRNFAGIVNLLKDMGVMNVSDVFLVEEMAVTYAALSSLRSELRKRGRTYETVGKDGTMMVRSRPEVAQEADRSRYWLQLLTKCGMTPADRSRVSSYVDDGPEDEMMPWVHAD